MASLQVGAAPVEDVITETESPTKEPQAVAPAPPPDMVKTVDVEDEEDLEDFTAPQLYEEKAENSDNEEDKDIEYSPFIEREETPPYGYAGEHAKFGDLYVDDAEDEDDAIN